MTSKIWVKLNTVMNLESVSRWGLHFTPHNANMSFRLKDVSRKTFQLPSTQSQGQNSESLFNIFLSLCLILNVLPQSIFVEFLICETNEFIKYVAKKIYELTHEMF